MSKRGVLLFVLSLLAGVVAGGFGNPKASDGAADLSASQPRETRAPKDKWKPDDFLAAARKRENSSELAEYSLFAAELALWSEDELKAALEECLHTPTGSLLLVRQEIQGPLFGKWFKRNPAAAMAWFEAIDPPSLKIRLANHVALIWPVEKAEEGFAYLLANRELFREHEGLFQHRLITARAKDGPDAVYAALERFRNEGLRVPDGVFKLPNDFDYAGLLARDVGSVYAGKEKVDQDGRDGLEWGLVQGWYKQDREHLFDWLLHEKGAAGLNWISRGEDQLKWLPGKIETLPTEQQHDFLTAVRDQWLYGMSDLKQFADATKDPELLAKVRALAVEGVVYSNIEPTMEVIGGIPDLEQRLQVLEETPIGPAPPKKGAFFHGGTADYLRKTLAGWGADSVRIEAIVARFSAYEPPTR